MWKRFRRWLSGEPLHKEDDRFGKMIFRKHRRKPELSYWVCLCPFRNQDRWIELQVPGNDPKGPAAAHKAFFNAIEERYPELIRAITPLLTAELCKECAEESGSDFSTAFTLVFMALPSLNDRMAEWEMIFTAEGHSDDQYIITLKDWEPVKVLADR